MDIESILAPEHTYCKVRASSKKRVIENIAIQLAETIKGLDAEEIFTNLINREKIGSTAIGHGIAIPHCRLDNCNEITCALFTLDTAIDFRAMDDEEVGILFVLLVPTAETQKHLEVLATLAGKFESETYRKQLASAKDNNELYLRAIS